jgi:hypothetical protein
MLQSVERASLSKYIGAALSTSTYPQVSGSFPGIWTQSNGRTRTGNKKRMSKTQKRIKAKMSLQSRRINRNK